MKTFLIIWVVVILYCFFEAITCAKLDPESKKFLDERENKLNKEKKWQQEE
jgi:hypothetical protein